MSLQDWLEKIADFPEEDARAEIVRLNEEIQERFTRLNALMALLQARTAVTHEGPVPVTTTTFTANVGGQVPIMTIPITPLPISQPPDAVETVSRAKQGTSAAILDVMETDPRRSWTAKEILLLLAHRGQLPGSTDPRRAVDATLHRLAAKTHQIERVARGRYRLVSDLPPKEQLALGPDDGHEENEEAATTGVHTP
jgi:hypothetical protein